ncbi:MAG: hypothetical protein IV085_13310, partial [Thiobacillus sp.]|nr:hypothetical protein [Thiobacillus sp.]
MPGSPITPGSRARQSGTTLNGRIGRVKRRRPAMHPDAAAVGPFRAVVEVGGDEVDHLQLQRLGYLQAHRLAHRTLGAFSVAAASCTTLRV